MSANAHFAAKIQLGFENILSQLNAIQSLPGKYDSLTDLRSPRITSTEVAQEQFESVRIQCLSLVNMLTDQNDKNLQEIAQRIRGLQAYEGDRIILRAIMSGLVASYEAGLLDKLIYLAEASIAADYLGQAEELLKDGQPGKCDHVPAAVLTGAILENALRTLCNRRTPPIDLVKSNGEPKTLNVLIDDLKKAGEFNELVAKQLRAWADIRNAAAHGEFQQFNRQHVELMLPGVQNFLADHL